MKLNDVASGAILLVFAIILGIAAQSLPNPGNQLYGPAFFPGWIALVMGVSAIIMIVTSRDQIGIQPFVRFDDWVRDPRRALQFALIPAAVIFYVYRVDVFGFMLTAAIVLAGLLLAHGIRTIILLPVTVGITLLLYAIFDRLLRVPLPRGTLLFQ